MTIVSGPKIVDDGLIFHYDMGNTSKSFKGKPTTNLNSEDIPDLEQIGSPTLTQYSSQTPIGTTAYTVTDSSTSNYQYIRRLGVATIPNDTSTYYLSLYIRKQAGTAIFGINWGFDGGGTPISNNSRFNTKTGVASGSGTGGGSVVDLGEWWRWIVTSSNNATGNTSLNVNIYPAAGQNGSDDPTATGTVVISALQVETGSFATPYVNGTRSNTQAIVDLTGNETVTANSLTYNSDGTFEFTSADEDFMTFPYTQSDPNNFTLEAWIYHTAHSTDTNIGHTIMQAYSNTDGWIFGLKGTDSRLNLRQHNVGAQSNGNITYTTGLSLNTWYHVVAVCNNTTDALYVNGVQVASQSHFTGTTGHGSCRIGAWGQGAPTAGTNFAGEIPIARIYHKGLSAAEVAQNFNASRTRFGI